MNGCILSNCPLKILHYMVVATAGSVTYTYIRQCVALQFPQNITSVN